MISTRDTVKRPVKPQFSQVLEKLLQTPIASHLRTPASQFLENTSFPEISEYNCKLYSPVSGAGVSVRFVPESKRMHKEGFRRLYQPRIFLTGEVSARPHHWHDFFDMLIWRCFPHTKAALNRRHFFAFDEIANFPWVDPPTFRTPEQDALTIFDEGGMVVVFDDEEVWKEGCRVRFSSNFLEQHRCRFKFFVFGHAIFEEVVKNHLNVVASSIGVFWNPEEMGKLLDATDVGEALIYADFKASKHLQNRQVPLLTKSFQPVPLETLLPSSLLKF